MGIYQVKKEYLRLCDIAREIYAPPRGGESGYLWQYLIYANPRLSLQDYTVLPSNLTIQFFDEDSLPVWASTITPQTNPRIVGLANQLAGVTQAPVADNTYNGYRAVLPPHVGGDFDPTDFLPVDWKTA